MLEYEQAVCPQCGHLKAVCSDGESLFYPQRTVCWATVAKKMAERQWHRLHERAVPDGDGWLPTDGTTIWVSTENLTPDDDFLNGLASDHSDERAG